MNRYITGSITLLKLIGNEPKSVDLLSKRLHTTPGAIYHWITVLKKAKLIQVSRGSTGGIYRAAQASKINVYDVYKAFNPLDFEPTDDQFGDFIKEQIKIYMQSLIIDDYDEVI